MGSFNLGGWATEFTHLFSWVMSTIVSGSSSGSGR